MKNQVGRTAVCNTEKTGKKVSMNSPTEAQLKKFLEIFQLDKTQFPRRDNTAKNAVEHEINTQVSTEEARRCGRRIPLPELAEIERIGQ